MRFRLLPTILACLATLVLISAGSILALSLFTTTRVVSDLVLRLVNQNLQGLELALTNYLDPATYEAEFLAERIGSGEIGFDDHDQLAAIATGSVGAVPQIIALVLTSTDGSTLRVTRDASGDIKARWLPSFASQRRQDRARQLETHTGPFWGEPVYSLALNQTVVNLHMPIRRDNEYLGYVGVGISTRDLSGLTASLANPPQTTVFVLYGRDKVLAYPTLASQDVGLSADKPLLGTADIGDPVVAGLPDAEPFTRIQAERASGIKIGQIDVDGTKYLAATKPIAGYADAPLEIGAYSAASDVNSPFRTISRTAMIGVGLFATALLLAIAMSRLIAQPIRRTSAGTEKIASLDFDHIAPLPPSWIKEIDDLAVSFNSMLVGLQSFGRYVPRALVNRLIRDKQVGAGTEERELTVMFTDIAGFTSICEGMSPSEVAAFINHHLALVSGCIEREGGTIDKYIGDAVMAFWGAPDIVDDASIRAARAAIAIRHQIAADNERRAAAGLVPVRIRIGIHTGPLIVGDIGAPSRLNYTVVGDVVNVAQRLEALGKEIGPDAESIVLMSDATRDGLGDGFEMIHVGRCQVKGKHEPVDVFQLLDSVPAT
jgi:adenylate cyclase